MAQLVLLSLKQIAFLGLQFQSGFAKSLKIFNRCRKCYAGVSLYPSKSSKQFNTPLRRLFLKISFMSRWKVVGAFVNPNGILTILVRLPLGVEMAFFDGLFLLLTLAKSYWLNHATKNPAPWNASVVLPIRGRIYAFIVVISFKLR